MEINRKIERKRENIRSINLIGARRQLLTQEAITQLGCKRGSASERERFEFQRKERSEDWRTKRKRGLKDRTRESGEGRERCDDASKSER